MTTHHDRILAELRSHILDGRWPHGHHLTFETDMAAAFGVSRMTINKVLSQLTRERFLERRRKLGTVVAMPRVQSAVMEITDIEREIRDLGLSYSFRLIALQRGLPWPEERAQMRDDTPAFEVLRCTAMHEAGGTPFCLEDRLINLTAAPAAATQDFRAQSPGRWLLHSVPWSSAEHRVRGGGRVGHCSVSLPQARGGLPRGCAPHRKRCALRDAGAAGPSERSVSGQRPVPAVSSDGR